MKLSKKLISLFLLAAVTLSACAQAPASSGDAAGGDAAAPQLDENALTPLGKYEEPVTISISKVMVTNPHLIEGQSPEDNIVLDWIRDELNINIEIAWQAESSEYNNKLSLNIASNSLPDMVYILGADYLTFRQMVDNDLLADLTEVYDKCAGDYLRATYDSFEGRNLDPLTIDGKLYAITSANIGDRKSVV